eukprot:GHVT01055753.1.p1 GENE.GHVT01055753.1~~GHVT01055753.1.p1  ORF type:complete len:269 (+),score=52.01 GHVT01055753.1:69-875(+)
MAATTDGSRTADNKRPAGANRKAKRKKKNHRGLHVFLRGSPIHAGAKASSAPTSRTRAVSGLARVEGRAGDGRSTAGGALATRRTRTQGTPAIRTNTLASQTCKLGTIRILVGFLYSFPSFFFSPLLPLLLPLLPRRLQAFPLGCTVRAFKRTTSWAAAPVPYCPSGRGPATPNLQPVGRALAVDHAACQCEIIGRAQPANLQPHLHLLSPRLLRGSLDLRMLLARTSPRTRPLLGGSDLLLFYFGALPLLGYSSPAASSARLPGSRP